jgi:hypothetical protein
LRFICAVKNFDSTADRHSKNGLLHRRQMKLIIYF